MEGNIMGACLFGRRDPDDHYAVTEIPTLQILMDHTALALKNIEQAQDLHALYQNDIEKHEEYRSSLARELHDGVLGEMAIIAQNLGDNVRLDILETAYHVAVNRIRSVISGLRPTMLNYGLRYALEELADDTMDLSSEKVILQLNIPSSQVRLPEVIELHLFRIIQQACQNAIQHGQADHIYLAGRIEQDFVDVIVKDNGCGFEASENMNLASLLANRHFGLAGMYERANFVGAEIDISSSPGKGTCLHVKWQPSSQD
jgi:two-component system sensor histidine kinase DegS